MAGSKKFYAATDIKHGRREEDGSQDGKIKEFNFAAGDEVTGLEPDEMKSLWRAGALTQEAPVTPEEDEEPAAPEQEASSTSTTTSATDTSKATKATNAGKSNS